MSSDPLTHAPHPSAADPFPEDAVSITKSELIARLASRYPQLAQRDAEYAVRALLDALTQSLVEGRRIEIRGFGSFAITRRPPRVGRNPKSGEAVQVPEKLAPHFKPGKELRARVDLAVPGKAPADPDAGWSLAQSAASGASASPPASASRTSASPPASASRTSASAPGGASSASASAPASATTGTLPNPRGGSLPGSS